MAALTENSALRTVNVLRYILPLREGGSLPVLAEADDGFKYVLKFREAGQREKMLIADLEGFLASKNAGYITGQVISINGGLYT